MSARSMNDSVWEKILEEVTAIEEEVANKGFYDIKSDVIKEYREPRLACKIDYRQSMPAPLEERGLSILAVKNKCYRLAKTDPFVDLDQELCEQVKKPEIFPMPSYIQAISPQNISSESKALDAALASGMLDSVVGDRVDIVLRGREFCQPIEFSLPDSGGDRRVNYQIEQVQLEVDGGYEGQNGVHLIEAKLALRDNMNLRQLLYPQLHYQKSLGNQKPVKTYVMFYEPGRGYFHFFRFRADGQYRFSDYRCCALETAIHFAPCWEELSTTKVDLEKTDELVPFPQADKFDKILAVFLKLHEVGPLTKEELFSEYNVVPRQFDYYANALRWMKVVEKIRNHDGVRYQLSVEGMRLAKKSEKEILFEMGKIIFSNDICNQFLFDENPDVTMESKKRNGLDDSGSTFDRRMRTIRSWRRYFREIFPERA